MPPRPRRSPRPAAARGRPESWRGCGLSALFPATEGGKGGRKQASAHLARLPGTRHHAGGRRGVCAPPRRLGRWRIFETPSAPAAPRAPRAPRKSTCIPRLFSTHFRRRPARQERPARPPPAGRAAARGPRGGPQFDEGCLRGRQGARGRAGEARGAHQMRRSLPGRARRLAWRARGPPWPDAAPGRRPAVIAGAAGCGGACL